MLKKLYNKSRIWFSVVWILLYCVLMSLGDALSEKAGTEKSVTLIIGLILSTIILSFLRENCLFESYGLCKSKSSLKSMLFYMPVLIMLTANLWYGVTVNHGVIEIILHILTMLLVGFLEEIIFRGFLFNAMREENEKAAIIVSAVTFGIGHIINLFNGSGAELLPNILQIIYASAAGFMFVMIYLKTDSLIICILSHGIFNALSIFSDNGNTSIRMQLFTCILLTSITGLYAIYIAVTLKKKKSSD